MTRLLSLLSLLLFVAVGTPTYAQGDKPSPDEIWYTSTDGKVVNPNSGAFGSEILSNTYRNGKGVIIVEGDCIVEIDIEAFSECTNLKSITIPDSVTSIGEGAFRDCPNLSSFAGKFATADGRCLIATGKLIAFAPSGLTLYSISDSVTSIGKYAFCGCSSLISITIPDSVTSIGDYAFRYCSSLTSITIPDGVTSIGVGAFYDCSSLTSITIPDSVTSIGNGAFWYCSSLTSITIPDSVTSIGAWAFEGCSSLTSITIPDGVTSIEGGAFASCESLTSITIPYGVTSIGEEAFSGCIKLEQVYLSSIIPPILKDNAFSENAQNLLIYTPKEAYKLYLSMECWKPYSNLLERYQPEGAQVSATITAREIWYTTTDGNIVKPNSGAFGSKILSNTYRNGKGVIIVEGDCIEWIGESAFSDCSSLKSITIPDSVTWIGDEAFNGCRSLTSINIPDSVTSIGSGAFENCKWLTSITIPDSVTWIGDEAFNGCRSLTSITIPDGVTSIGESAFRRCSSLTSITIPDSVTSIGESAFENCKWLTSVNITDIAAWCRIRFSNNWANPLFFAHNLYLNGELVTDLIIPDSVTSIGWGTFWGCSSLTSATIPDSVTSIGYYAFWGCSSMTSVTIPDSVTSIGESAFYGCCILQDKFINNSALDSNIHHYWGAVVCDIIQEDGLCIHGTTVGGCRPNATHVTIPDSVTSIGNGAFWYCSSLTSITIPDSVTSIEDYAFEDCSSLKEVYCKPTTPPSGGNNMFYNNASGRKIYVPRGSVNAYKNAENWSKYADAIVGYDF